MDIKTFTLTDMYNQIIRTNQNELDRIEGRIKVTKEALRFAEERHDEQDYQFHLGELNAYSSMKENIIITIEYWKGQLEHERQR